MRADLYPVAQLLEAAVHEIVPLEGTVGDFWCAILYADPLDEPTWEVVCGYLGWHKTTTQSRFARAGLASPHAYLTAVRLVYAAHLFGRENDSITNVAYRMGFSTPQAFGRHLRRETGMTPTEYRDTVPYPVARDAFLDNVVRVGGANWQTFDPTPQRVAA